MGLLDRLVDDVFSEFSDHGRKFFESFHPAADVYICEKEIIVDVDLPGCKDHEITYEVYGGQDVCGCWFEWAHLYIKITRKSTIPKNCEKYLAHRPLEYVARIPLPIRIKKDGAAPVSSKPIRNDGVVTFKIPASPSLIKTVLK